MNKKHTALLTLIFMTLLCITAGCSDDNDSQDISDHNPALGQNWSRIEVIGGYTNRRGAGVAVLNNKLYLAGGRSSSPSALGDCWSTTDGTNWQQETATGFNSSGLRSFAMTAYDGKIWAHGGANQYSSVQTKIRHSTDGASWTALSLTITTNTRTDHCMIAFKGALWTIAGSQRPSGLPSSITNSVACSTDGTTWTSMPDAPFASRKLAGITVHNGKMWIIGGKTNSSAANSKNDVWYTDNGSTWVCATSNAAFSPRNNFGLVTSGNRMYLIGGEIASGVVTNDVWKSYDGITWEQVAVTNTFPARSEPAVIAFNGGIYVIAGYRSGVGYTNDIWFTK